MNELVVVELVLEPLVQPELSVVVPENLLISEQALQFLTPPRQPNTEFPIFIPPFKVHEGVTFGNVAGPSSTATNGQGKEFIVITDFHSPEPDKPTSPNAKLDTIILNLSELSFILSQLKQDQHATSKTIFTKS